MKPNINIPYKIKPIEIPDEEEEGLKLKYKL